MPHAAVVDTNILVSALLRPASGPGEIARSIVSGRLVPVVCDEILAEYTAVLNRPRFGFDARDVSEFLSLLAQLATWVRITDYPAGLNLPDPDDWPFVATALAARCPVITGNMRDFPAGSGVHAVSPREWLDRHDSSEK